MIMSNRKRSVIHALNCVMKSIFCFCHCSQILSIRYTFPFPFDSFTPNVRIKIMNFSFPFWPQANVKSQVVCVQCHFYVLALAALHEKQESWRASAVSWEARRIANLNTTIQACYLFMSTTFASIIMSFNYNFLAAPCYKTQTNKR